MDFGRMGLTHHSYYKRCFVKLRDTLIGLLPSLTLSSAPIFVWSQIQNHHFLRHGDDKSLSAADSQHVQVAAARANLSSAQPPTTAAVKLTQKTVFIVATHFLICLESLSAILLSADIDGISSIPFKSILHPRPRFRIPMESFDALWPAAGG